MRYETRKLHGEEYGFLTSDPPNMPPPTLPTPRLWVLLPGYLPPDLILHAMSRDVLDTVRDMACVAAVEESDRAGVYNVTLNPLYIADNEMLNQTRVWMQYEMERLFPHSALAQTTADPDGLRLEDYDSDVDDDFGDEPDGVGGHARKSP